MDENYVYNILRKKEVLNLRQKPAVNDRWFFLKHPFIKSFYKIRYKNVQNEKKGKYG